MKKKLILLVIVLIVISIIGSKIYFDAANVIKHPLISTGDNIEVKVNNGDSLNNVINNLSSDNKMGNMFLVKWYIKKHNLNTNIKPGTYIIPKDVTIESFVSSLNNGKYNENAVRVTIPEGYDINKIAALLQEKQIISKEEFLNAVSSYNLPSYIKKDSNRKYSLEGYLFPDTYDFTKGMKGKDIIDVMVKNFETVINTIKTKNNITLSDDKLDEKITMASIVEREAELSSERATVASVFYNRINKNIKLQSCATVEYVLGVHKTVYSEKDISVQSVYNTYYVSGLPAGPICSPGKESILAALMPGKSNYLYFVSKFDGTKAHFFSDNYNQFLNDKKVSESNYAKMNK
ncbi:YceG family protein [Clostridiales bacterium oral taxon 876 str. F0540]|nr:YceG family protein [Clostridiales bacterium oral taxon 876 str. F0540]